MTVVLGVLVLAGWVFEIPALRSVLPGAVQMKANTALGLTLAGAALFLLADRARSQLHGLSLALALIVTVLGLATLGEWVFGWRLGIDELLFRDPSTLYTPWPGRMAPPSAFAFICLGPALMAVRSTRLSRWSGYCRRRRS